MSQWNEYWDHHKDAILEDYFTYLKFPSVSTDPKNAKDVRNCAMWVKDYLEDIGLDVQVWETDQHPTLFATDLSAGDKKPTLLIYHHYDVQPVDPIELWQTPPFEPEIRNGAVYARGASDNKGQSFFTITAIKALKKLGFNLKLIIEGEEEVGSPGLEKLCSEKVEELKADYMLVVDVDMHAIDQPALTLGTRGITTLEVEVRGSDADLHSGNHGGIVYNPARALSEALSKMWKDGRVAIDGFYDGVEKISADFLDMDFDEEGYKRAFGVAKFAMPKGVTPLAANWLEPTLEINGLSSGYTGEGFKTIIPAVAKAKISARLVPGQDPNQIAELIALFLKKELAGMKVKTELHHGGMAVQTPVDAPFVKLAAKALKNVFKKECKFIMTGGSIPISATLKNASGADVLFMGFAFPGDAIHSPNEHFDVERLRLGFLSMAELMELL